MSSTLSPLCLAPAQRQDAAVLVKIHYAAVHQTAASYYKPVVLQNWAPPPTRIRVARFEWMLTSTDGVWLVVKQLDQVVGFGVMIPTEQLLKGLYVYPPAGRQGLGTQLLRALEAVAIRQGVNCLHVHAALNAVSFYQHRGYHGMMPRQHFLPSGQFMCCVDMYKRLGH